MLILNIKSSTWYRFDDVLVRNTGRKLEFINFIIQLNYITNNVERKYTEVRKSQIKGKEIENSYQELKRSQKDRHTQTHGNCIEIFWLAQQSFSIEREWRRLCRVFTNIYSLSIEKDSCASWNISILFPCVCVWDRKSVV